MNSTPDLNMVNAYIPGRVKLNAATAALIERRDALLGPAYRLMYEHPLHIVRGEGAWLIATNGDRYLDFASGVAVNALGLCSLLSKKQTSWRSRAASIFRRTRRVRASEM